MLYKNKRGIVNQLLIVLVVAVILAIIVLMFWVGSMTLPLLTGAGTTITNQISTSINSNNPNSELANATSVPVNLATNVLGVVETIVYIVLIVMFLGFIMLAYYVRTYPFLAYFWVFIIIGLTFLSMFVSNAYMTARDTSSISSYYATWGTNDLLMSNLPIIVVIVGVIGGIFLFILASREPESETQTL